MLGLDSGFCAIMRAAAETMIGRGVLEVTVPDDRPACLAGMSRLRRTGQPFSVRKRMQRGDGSVVWVEQSTTRVEFPDAAPTIVATFRPIASPADEVEPAALLAQARFLCDARAAREDVFGPILFVNPAWALLLRAYIAEAEGRTLDIVAMARAARIAPAAALRWGRALASEGMFDLESGGDGVATAPVYRLTADAHGRLERYLSHRLARLAGVCAISPQTPALPSLQR